MDIAVRLLLAWLAIVVAGAIGWLCWRRRSTPGAVALLILAGTLAAWGALYALWWGKGLPSVIVVRSVSVLAGSLAGITFFLFVLQYTQRAYTPTWLHFLVLAILPLTVQGLLWGRLVVQRENLWQGINAIYAEVLLLLAAFFLVRVGIYGPRPYRRQFALLLFGALVPFFTNLLNLFEGQLGSIHLTPVPYTITATALLLGLVRYRLLSAIPLPRDLVIEKMGDGWMVLDARDRVVDLNPAAEHLLGTARDRIFGKQGKQVLARWQSINLADDKEVSIQGSVRVGEEWRYLQMRVSPLRDDRHFLGRVILWKDITEWQKAEEARRQARDEMFVLLHAISGAATRAMSLDDFLTDALFQIAYAFHSRMSALFLLEESQQSFSERLFLKAYHGMPAEAVQRIAIIPEIPPFIQEVLCSGEARQIPDIRWEANISEATRQLGAYSLLVLPLRMEGKALGMICLTRPAGELYRQDEITRLMVVADEIATFIYSDRQRHLNIALAERQRLVRDLHDSLSAKLYGVLTLTEAAQAGLEAGHADMPARVLTRIGEQARQALKEMRLFLHELEPIDLERQGLAAAIAQRLSAVEGRADIRTHIFMDDRVTLPIQSQVALYFIAQEALNNALRHANARSVTVRLQKRRDRLVFEIRDDGCGFDQQQVGNGGRGLRNMQERAEKIGARLTVDSRPGRGTIVRVVLPGTPQESPGEI